jgi:hypothetical protein
MVLLQSRYYPDYRLEGLIKLQKTSVSMFGDMAEILSRIHPNIIVESYCFTKPFGELISKRKTFGSTFRTKRME